MGISLQEVKLQHTTKGRSSAKGWKQDKNGSSKSFKVLREALERRLTRTEGNLDILEAVGRSRLNVAGGLGGEMYCKWGWARSVFDSGRPEEGVGSVCTSYLHGWQDMRDGSTGGIVVWMLVRLVLLLG